MQDGGLLRQQHAYHGEDDDDDDDTSPYGVVEWYGGPFITTANHNLSVNDDTDYEHTQGLIPDEDWRRRDEDGTGGAVWAAAQQKKGEEGGWREVVAFYRSAEAWRKPNLMYIFFSFFLYMLAYSYSSAMIPLVRALSIIITFYYYIVLLLFYIVLYLCNLTIYGMRRRW